MEQDSLCHACAVHSRWFLKAVTGAPRMTLHSTFLTGMGAAIASETVPLAEIVDRILCPSLLQQRTSRARRWRFQSKHTSQHGSKFQGAHNSVNECQHNTVAISSFHCQRLPGSHHNPDHAQDKWSPDTGEAKNYKSNADIEFYSAEVSAVLGFVFYTFHTFCPPHISIE